MKQQLANLCRPILERMVFTRHLPADLAGAGIYVSPRVDARVLRNSIEEMDPDLLAAARCLLQPGATVWDIGSNLGVFSMAAAHLAGAKGFVLAVDADAAHMEMLRKTQDRAQTGVSAKVVPLHSAVSTGVGMARLNIVGRGKANNFLSDVAARPIERCAFNTVALPEPTVT